VAGYVIRGDTGIAGCAEPDTIPASPRILPVFGRRPG
jgi:hypothetical protein